MIELVNHETGRTFWLNPDYIVVAQIAPVIAHCEIVLRDELCDITLRHSIEELNQKILEHRKLYIAK